MYGLDSTTIELLQKMALDRGVSLQSFMDYIEDPELHPLDGDSHVDRTQGFDCLTSVSRS